MLTPSSATTETLSTSLMTSVHNGAYIMKRVSKMCQIGICYKGNITYSIAVILNLIHYCQD